ncbi:hypothetical protein HMPREF9176_1424 [Streptococcus downei F0415]|nr:hypothetical protein HMPREF9176_1424 [Streptococcus downei F0415]
MTSSLINFNQPVFSTGWFSYRQAVKQLTKLGKSTKVLTPS